jgi:hypothetical protein
VFQLSAPGLAARFPPRRTAGQVVGNSAVLAALQADPAGRELMARSASPSAVPVCSPIRTRTSTGSGHGSRATSRWAASAARAASSGVQNATAKASPAVENT